LGFEIWPQCHARHVVTWPCHHATMPPCHHATPPRRYAATPSRRHMATCRPVRRGVSQGVEDSRRLLGARAAGGSPLRGHKTVSGVARPQGVEELGMAGRGETLGSPWIPLAIRACGHLARPPHPRSQNLGHVIDSSFSVEREHPSRKTLGNQNVGKQKNDKNQAGRQYGIRMMGNRRMKKNQAGKH
jgi:hypothetical protein